MAELETYNLSEVEKAKLLVKYGFINSDYKEIYSTATKPEEREKIIAKFEDPSVLTYKRVTAGSYSFLKPGHADQEYDEEQRDNWMATDYPKTTWKYRVDYERYDMSLEESYFWILNWLKVDGAYANIIKVTDVFAAATQSDFWGVASQRIGLQQDKVSQFLATVGKMIKELFQLVRELRILDERVDYYKDAESGVKSAEITLKGIYIDMAEGGTKNPASVFGMARELQFITLPDLFFDAPSTLKSNKDIDDYVDKLGFNIQVKNVLKRKLYSFIRWKDTTYKELKVRRTFTIKYLRQHFDIIRMYSEWVKPYLKNIRRLTMSQGKSDTADLISAFEGSMIEMEFIAARTVESSGKFNSVVLVNFDCRTRPTMSFHQEGYAQRGPIHTGRVVINIRAYAWTDEQIKNYVKMRNEESLKLLSDIDDSLKAAMEAMGADLMEYLEEAGETKIPKIEEDVKTAKLSSAIAPFAAVVKGAGELAGAFFPRKKEKKPKKKKENKFELDNQKKKALDFSRRSIWNLYDKYKKAHGMLAW